MPNQANYTVLAQFPFFHGLPSSLLDSWTPNFSRQRFAKRQPLIFPASCPDVIFFVISGKVKISYYSEDGKEFTVAILSQGEVYSEHSMALATAVEESEVFYLSMDAFRLMMDESPELARRLIRVLGQILRITNDLVIDLAFREAASRLARVFWRAIQSAPAKDKDPCVLHFTHEELASLSGTTRQTVTEILRHWERQGILALQRGQVMVKDINRLQGKFNG